MRIKALHIAVDISAPIMFTPLRGTVRVRRRRVPVRVVGDNIAHI